MLILADRLGALPTFEPMAIWVAAIVGVMAGAATLAFLVGGAVALWATRANQGDLGHRAMSVLKAGLTFTTGHSVCRACVGRGFTWTLAPTDTRVVIGAGVPSEWQLAPTRLKVECPSCGGSGFTDT